MQCLKLQITIILLIILHILDNLHKDTIKIFEHEPKIREILFLAFGLTEGRLEIVVKQLVTVRVRMGAQDIA